MRLTLPPRYTAPAIVLHWLVALGIMINVLIMWTLSALPERPAVNLHKSIGITVLGLAILRLLWRLTHKPPPLPPGTRRWERLSAHAAHTLLYVLIFALPLTGWIHDSAWKAAAGNPLTLFGVIPWFRISAVQDMAPGPKEHMHALFGQLHTSCAYVLYALLAAHILGALKHQFVDNRPSLRRMWIT